VVLSNGTLLSNKYGLIKERTQTIDSYVLWGCAGSAHAQIRQLANFALRDFSSVIDFNETWYRHSSCE